MALKAVVADADFVALDDGVKALYEKTESGNYALAIDGVDDLPTVKGLKNNHDQLLTEKKAADKAKKEAEIAAANASAAEAAKRGEYEQLYKSAQAKLDETLQQVEEIKGRVAAEKLNTAAVKLASALSTDPGRQELLAEKIEKRLALTDEGIKVKDKAGNLSIMSLEKLGEEMKASYPFLADGNKASGGGAARHTNTGGAGGGKKFNEYSGGELKALLKDQPEEYERLRSEFYNK